jgi:hypothetical protein
MHTLPREYTTILTSFARLFSKRAWRLAQTLLIGAILTPGQRTVTAALRILGLEADQHFQNYHRVLNRAQWSNLEVSELLLAWLVKTFVPTGRIFLGLDDTIERRRGAKIKAKGIYRDPVRSSQSHFVKASGLRWLSLMLLTPIPWAKRVWALPFLTALCPSERYYEQRVRGHKKLTDWARQMLFQVYRWLPGRQLVVLADSSFAALELLGDMIRLPNPICMMTRFRLDAALYEPAPERKAGQKGRPRKKGARLPTLKQVLDDPKTNWKKVTVPDWYGEGPKTVELASDTAVWFHNGLPPVPIRWVLIRDPKGSFKPQALLCTDLSIQPEQIVTWYVMRWRVEVTFHEVRTHLGVETQRQWSDLAIARTTPILLGLFSLVTLLAHTHAKRGQLPVRQAAWYSKPLPTFIDALAIVRHNLWQHLYFQPSHFQGDIRKIPAKALECLRNAVCYTV